MRWVEDAGIVEKLVGTGIHTTVCAFAVLCGLEGLRHRPRCRNGVKSGGSGVLNVIGHHVNLLEVLKGTVRLLPAERVGVVFGHVHHQEIKGRTFCVRAGATRALLLCCGWWRGGVRDVFAGGDAWKRDPLTAGTLLVSNTSNAAHISPTVVNG